MPFYVKRYLEEFECDYCSCPVYVGDQGYEGPEWGLYCSQACAHDHAGELAIHYREQEQLACSLTTK
jgi:hypothetical protein